MLRLMILAAVLLASSPLRAAETAPLRVYAAASLSNALQDIGKAWQAEGHAEPTLVFAGSSTLAKQILAGAPADVFASADGSWMDALEQAGAIAPASRVDRLGNRLVLIAPKGSRLQIPMQAGFDIAAAFKGRLCTGEPGVVPVGTYARAALQSLGWWSALQARIVGAEDVRTALAFVERGECALGIVYATDAAISRKVQVLARFPESTHPRIVYPFALTSTASPAAREWFDYLHSAAARAVFERYGFTLLAR